MSHRDVYNDEMPETTISEQDAERIIAGKTPEQADLADLALLKDTIHDYYVQPPSEESVTRLATMASDALLTRPDLSPQATGRKSSLWARARRRTMGMAAGLAAALLFAGFSILALVADGAAPGDPLYGVDRAVERLGVRDGGAAERIVEAQAILAEGNTADAVEHVAEAANPEDGDDVVVDALRATASHLRSNEDDAVRARVTHMLDWVAGADPSSSDFEQRMAAVARGVSSQEDGEGSP